MPEQSDIKSEIEENVADQDTLIFNLSVDGCKTEVKVENNDDISRAHETSPVCILSPNFTNTTKLVY